LCKGRVRLSLYLVFVLSILGSVAFAGPQYPKPKGNVNDYVGVLNKSDLDNLNALADAVLRQTGATFAVAIIDNHGDESLEIYSAKLYEQWGIGKKNEDKGLLVVVSMKEHDLRMEVGYGLESIITDGRAGECLDRMLPYFKNEEYGRGLYAGLLHAGQYIAQDAGVKLEIKPLSPGYYGSSEPESGVAAFQWIILLFLFPVLFGIVLGSRGKRCPRCKSKLTVVDRVVKNATYATSGIAVRRYECPVCGYYREKTYKTAPLVRPPRDGGFPPIGGPGPFIGGGFGRGSRGGGFFGPRGFGGGRSGGGGASRKW